MSKKKKRIFLLMGILAGIFLCWWVNTFTLTTHEIIIKDEKIKNEIKIVQLTDLHGASFGKENNQLIHKIQTIKPDLICVTGDMYTAEDAKGRERALALMTSLAKEYSVYYVNGEHDGDRDFWIQLEEGGIHVLNYQTEDIKIGDTKLKLYGITNQYYSPTFNLAKEFTLDPEAYNILLAHIPNFSKFAQFGIDLSLCGDTHGGQIRLPFIGGLYNRGAWFPELNTAEGSETGYVKGLYKKGESLLFISSGLGNYPIPIRFCNLPEVALLVLEPDGSNQADQANF